MRQCAWKFTFPKYWIIQVMGNEKNIYIGMASLMLEKLPL